MSRIFLLSALLILTVTFISCSGTSKVSEQQSSSVDKGTLYPEWYPQQEFVSEGDRLLSFATAIDSDSASAVNKAVEWAKKELKSGVSDKLEEIRTEAVKEFGGQSGLDEARFLMALRKINKAVDPLIETGNTAVKTVEGYNSVRGFAKVSVPKDKLVDQIEDLLTNHQESWQKIKESEAFKNF